MLSVLSYKNRGPWGQASYRGNCSGHIVKDLLSQFKPNRFIELFAGSGTGYEVAQSMNYQDSLHLDLNPEFGESYQSELGLSVKQRGKVGGWNALKNEIPLASDFVFSHPPYHNMVIYSGSQWGEPHPDDLSRCSSYEEFLYKLNEVNAKVYASLLDGGRHALLIGDLRKRGKYFSIVKDMAFYGELEAHLIKVQHNCWSDRVPYAGNQIWIAHEHVLIFRKNHVWLVPVVLVQTSTGDLRKSRVPTWRDLVLASLESLKGKATLKDLYRLLGDSQKAMKNPNWKAKIRQTLQYHAEFYRVERGVYGLRGHQAII